MNNLALPWEGFKKLPDRGVVNYVRDLLKSYEVEVDLIEKKYPHWLPVGIVGTLDWIMICGWWVFRNTGFFNSEDGHRFVVEFDGCEFDPDMILVFLDNPERNKYLERLNSPGLDRMERTEALQFLQEDVFGSWAKSQGKSEKDFTPPQPIVEMMMWATFMWVMSEYGRDWLYNQDELLACIIEYGAAYMEKWSPDQTLLDPTKVVMTRRPIHTCRYCGHDPYCVRGAFIDNSKWQHVCVNCLIKLWEQGIPVDEKDDRVRMPKCPHLRGSEGGPRTCTAICPHSQVTEETIWENMEEVGSQRLTQYRESMNMAGANHRQLAGQTLDDIINHFK